MALNNPKQNKFLRYISILRQQNIKNLIHLPVNVALKLYIYSHTGTEEMGKGYLLVSIRPM